MSIQEVLDERRHGHPIGSAMDAQHVWRTEVTVSGAGGSRISSAATVTNIAVLRVGTTMSQEYKVVYTEVASSAGNDYDPDFVASILHADAAPPEASFNNVVDMLNWLNRD